MITDDILIIVKTYPEISAKYTETVCTAGILAKSKKFVRLYPVRFRYLEGHQKFRKYQWIRANISKANRDPRPESFNPDPDTIELKTIIPTAKFWEERRKWVLNENTVFDSVEKLREAQERNGTSLGIVKPKQLIGVYIKKRNKKNIEAEILKKDSVIKQLDMFEQKKDIYIMPVRIIIEFCCNESGCIGHKMSILDWEFSQLYRKIINQKDWEEKIKNKIKGEIFANNRETYLILGNMAAHPQAFSIIGFFWPPVQRQQQTRMFD